MDIYPKKTSLALWELSSAWFVGTQRHLVDKRVFIDAQEGFQVLHEARGVEEPFPLSCCVHNLLPSLLKPVWVMFLLQLPPPHTCLVLGCLLSIPLVSRQTPGCYFCKDGATSPWTHCARITNRIPPPPSFFIPTINSYTERTQLHFQLRG